LPIIEMLFPSFDRLYRTKFHNNVLIAKNIVPKSFEIWIDFVYFPDSKLPIMNGRHEIIGYLYRRQKMRRYMFTLGAFCVLLLLSPTGQNIILAEETSQPEDYFIDLDGDGFDDNIQDANSNNDLENSETTNKTDFKSDDDKSKLVSLDFGQSFREI